MNATRLRWLWAALLLCAPLLCVRSLAGTYDKDQAVAYARQYAMGQNPAWPNFSDNDCTNFVSQALVAGGWEFKYAPYDSVTGWYFVWGANWFDPQDDSWYNADYLFHFLLYSGRGVYIGWGNKDNPGNVGALQPGDLIFADWYKDSRHDVGNDGTMDHAMIVTQKDADGTVRVSYHSIAHKDRPISEVMHEPNTGQYGRYFYFRMHTQFDIAPATTVVSESSAAPRDGAAGFFRHGTPGYWHDASGVGDGGHMLWTWNNSASADNVGDWRPNLAVDGFYQVYAFVPRLHGTTAQARYQVYGADGRTDVVVNQNAISDAWVSLGTHWFNAGTGGLVRLADATGERGVTKQVAFDTVVWVPQNSFP